MSGEHTHPDYDGQVASVHADLVAAADRLNLLTAQVVALEAHAVDTDTRLTALEVPMVTYRYLGKPSGTLTVGGSYTDLDASRWDPPGSGWEHTLIYLNVTPTFKSGKTRGAGVRVGCRCEVRTTIDRFTRPRVAATIR